MPPASTARRRGAGSTPSSPGGLLIRSAGGGVGFRPGLVQEDRVREQIQGQLREIAAIANQLLRLGVLAED